MPDYRLIPIRSVLPDLGSFFRRTTREAASGLDDKVPHPLRSTGWEIAI